MVSHHPYLVPHHPCLVPHLCLISHHMTWTTPLLGNPIMCLEPHHVSGTLSLSGIPSTVWYPTPVPHSHHIAPTIPSASGHWCLYLASNCPLPLIWPQAAHHLKLLPHTTPTTPATAIRPTCTLPSPLPAIWPSLHPCPCPIIEFQPCYHPPAPLPLAI